MANNYTAKDIKKHIAALNAVPGIPQMASIVGGKDKMKASFIDTVDEATDAGMGDSIPAPVRKFYAAITAPEGKENATGGKQGGDDPAPAPKPPRRTRGKVFAEMLASGTLPPGNRKAWAEAYLAEYGGSKAESIFRVNCYADLLVNMGLVAVDEKGVHSFTG